MNSLPRLFCVLFSSSSILCVRTATYGSKAVRSRRLVLSDDEEQNGKRERGCDAALCHSFHRVDILSWVLPYPDLTLFFLSATTLLRLGVPVESRGVVCWLTALLFPSSALSRHHGPCFRVGGSSLP